MSYIKKSVKSLAMQKGIKMSDIAAKMDKTPSGFTNFLNGNPGINQIEKLADAIGVKASEIIALAETIQIAESLEIDH